MNGRKRWAILELYCGESGKIGFYNSQELGLARALREKEIETTIVYPVLPAETADTHASASRRFLATINPGERNEIWNDH